MFPLLLFLVQAALAPQSPAPPGALFQEAARAAPISQVVGADNLEEWASFIRPSDSERKFEDIGWRNQFWPAVLEARALGRPILLWTMNGHPLGCT